MRTAEAQNNHASWWWHDMEVIAALLALCAGNPVVTLEWPPHPTPRKGWYCRPVMIPKCCRTEQDFQQTVEFPVIWATLMLMWHHHNNHKKPQPSFIHHHECTAGLQADHRINSAVARIHPIKHAHCFIVRLFCYSISYCWVHVINLAIFFRVTSLLVWHLHDFPSTSEAIVQYMHNIKTQQSMNHVPISWDKWMSWLTHTQMVHFHDLAVLI